MNKHDKADEIIYFGLLSCLLIVLIGALIWVINWNNVENKKRYKELPDISVVEENLKSNLITKEPFSYIKYEFSDEDILVYYFVFDEPQLYYKVVYVFKHGTFMDKRWQYWKVLPSWKEEAYEE